MRGFGSRASSSSLSSPPRKRNPSTRSKAQRSLPPDDRLDPVDRRPVVSPPRCVIRARRAAARAVERSSLRWRDAPWCARSHRPDLAIVEHDHVAPGLVTCRRCDAGDPAPTMHTSAAASSVSGIECISAVAIHRDVVSPSRCAFWELGAGRVGARRPAEEWQAMPCRCKRAVQITLPARSCH